MSKRLTTLVGPDEPGAAPALPDLVADMHSMMSEQKKRNDAEGMVGQRLDALLGMMGDEKERHAWQGSGQSLSSYCHEDNAELHVVVDQVLAIAERQRQDNEMLLRALATGKY